MSARDQVEALVASAPPWKKAEPDPFGGLFRVVDMEQPDRNDDQAWYLAGYVPANHVTMIGAHGGTGKSTFALHVGACMAARTPAFGIATRQARVLFFSAEDPASLVLRRLRLICRGLGLSYAEVCRWLQVIDASDLSPVLFTEQRIDGVRHGITTPTYKALADYIEREGFEVLIVDNASDAFDADEINRAMVRAFVRSLKALVPSTGAVLLLAHVDKITSKFGKDAGTEAYSGSTAWHNSVRSRLFMLETEPNVLELRHQKSNLGPKQPPLQLAWPQDGIMHPLDIEPASGFIAGIQSKNDTKALMRLIHEYASRGEFVHPKHNSQSSAGKLFANEKGYPKGMKPAEACALLRDAERDGWIIRETYRGADRKQHERWTLTPSGIEAIGVAPSAPSAPSSEHGAL